VHPSSESSGSRRETRGKGQREPRPAFGTARGVLVTLVCAFAMFAAGCHRQSNISNYGLAWVTVNSEAGSASTVSTRNDLTSYIVTIDSIVLVRNDGQQFEALATPEIVDLTQLSTNTELWGTATIPNGTYVSALVTLDYSDALITTVINGTETLCGTTTVSTAQPCSVLDTTGATPTTFDISVTFDPANPLVVTPTYASTSANLMELDIDLGASGYLKYSGTTPEYIVNPYITMGTLPADNKLIRIRGPLINTNNTITTGGATGTYSVYVRPFHDEVNNLGAFSLFSTADTIFSLNGTSYTGNAGITAMSQLSAGSTMTAAYTTFAPDYNPANQAYAGTFYPVYVVAGSTLEDNYTEGLSGDVVARTGNLLTLRRSTLFINVEEVFDYESTDTFVQLGAGTLVTADDTTLTGLNLNSIGVGQHIEARGIYTIATDGSIVLDATGTSATNTGSVRLISTQLYGSLTSTATGSLTMNLSAIDGWPVSTYTFTGNGTSAAADPLASAFVVDTGSLALPTDLAAASPVFVNGLVTAFGSAPPDFTATAVNSLASVQLAGGTLTPAGTQSCGLGSQVCQPASLRVLYTYPSGTAAPFATLSTTSLTLDKTNAALVSAVVTIGPLTIDLTTLPTNLTLMPTTLPVVTPTTTTSSTQPTPFGPQYSIGNPVASTITETVTTASATLHVYSSFPSFVTDGYNGLASATNPVLQLTARGVYDSTTNTFTATGINVVL
jgi:hypothetical protein